MDKLTRFLLAVSNLAVLVVAAQQGRRTFPFSEMFLYMGIASLASFAVGYMLPWLKTHWRGATAAAVALCVAGLLFLNRGEKRSEAAATLAQRPQASEYDALLDEPPSETTAAVARHPQSAEEFLNDSADQPTLGLQGPPAVPDPLELKGAERPAFTKDPSSRK